MSNQAIRQIGDQVYEDLIVGTHRMTDRDWWILVNSSLVGRKMWVFDVSEQTRHFDDALLMVDLTIESTARALQRAH